MINFIKVMLSWFALLQIISVVTEMLSTLQKCSDKGQCYSWFLPVLNTVSRQLMTMHGLIDLQICFSCLILVDILGA